MSKKTLSGEVERNLAEARVEEIKKKIEGLWSECAALADKHRFKFSYSGPDGYGSGGDYYPPKPGDWIDGDYDSEENRDHPEYEPYHPWNDNNDGWVSSSSRC